MKLVIINGPCGVGKSTAAEVVHQALPISISLDIDGQRRLYSQYRENTELSWSLAQATALAMASVALEASQDVVLDKMQYFPDWYGQWIDLGKETGAETFEFVLWASKQTVLDRADARGYKPGGQLTHEAVENFWHKIDEFKDTRPNAHVLDVEHASPAEISQQILKIIGA